MRKIKRKLIYNKSKKIENKLTKRFKIIQKKKIKQNLAK